MEHHEGHEGPKKSLGRTISNKFASIVGQVVHVERWASRTRPRNPNGDDLLRSLSRSERSLLEEEAAADREAIGRMDEYLGESERGWASRLRSSLFGTSHLDSGLIHPSSLFASLWIHLIVLATLFACFAAPFDVAFSTPPSIAERSRSHAGAPPPLQHSFNGQSQASFYYAYYEEGPEAVARGLQSWWGGGAGPAALVGILRALMILAEVLFVLDPFVRSRLGYEVQGAVVMDSRLIWERYKDGPLVRDLLAALSVLSEMPRVGNLIGGRVLRLLMLGKLPGAVSAILTITEPIADRTGSLAVTLALLLMAFTVVAHLLAALWFFVQTRQDCPAPSAAAAAALSDNLRPYSSFYAYVANKVSRNGHGGHEGYEGELEDLPPGSPASCSWLGSLPDLEPQLTRWSAGQATLSDTFDLWAACFYWASSAGDGFNANTTPERLTAVLGQITVVNGLAAFILANLIEALTDQLGGWQRHSRYRRKIDAVNGYMTRHGFPKSLIGSVRRYYREVWTRQQVDLSDSQLLSELPGPLKKQVMVHLTRRLLQRSGFFADYLSSPPPKPSRAGRPHSKPPLATQSPVQSIDMPSQASLESDTEGFEAEPLMAEISAAQRGARSDRGLRWAARHIHGGGKDWEAGARAGISTGAAGAAGAAPQGLAQGQYEPAGIFDFGSPRGAPGGGPGGGSPSVRDVSQAERELWLESIAARLDPVSAAPGDLIVRQGDPGAEMFIIKQGKVAVEVDGRPVAYSTSGQYFGEMALMDIGGTSGEHRRLASVRAVTYCELFKLTSQDMREIWSAFPRLRRIMEAVALAKLKQNNDAVAGGGSPGSDASGAAAAGSSTPRSPSRGPPGFGLPPRGASSPAGPGPSAAVAVSGSGAEAGPTSILQQYPSQAPHGAAAAPPSAPSLSAARANASFEFGGALLPESGTATPGHMPDPRGFSFGASSFGLQGPEPGPGPYGPSAYSSLETPGGSIDEGHSEPWALSADLTQPGPHQAREPTLGAQTFAPWPLNPFSSQATQGAFSVEMPPMGTSASIADAATGIDSGLGPLQGTSDSPTPGLGQRPVASFNVESAPPSPVNGPLDDPQ